MKWSCGFYTIYNTAKIENTLGQKSIDNITYYNAVLSFILDPTGSSSFEERKCINKKLGINAYLSDSVHGFQIFHSSNDWLIKTKIIPLIFSLPSAYHIFRQKMTKKIVYNNWKNIYSKLNTDGPQVVRFFCLIENKEGNHIILLSVVKNANNQRSLYILDNMNEYASEDDQKYMLEHVQYIHKHIFPEKDVNELKTQLEEPVIYNFACFNN